VISGLGRKQIFIASVFEAFILSGLVFYCAKAWYPGELFDLFDITPKLIFFLGALFLLGPLLNVYVYKDDHFEYVNDLTVIYLLKLLVLLVGLHLFFNQRPVLHVFAVDRIVLVQAHQVPLGQVPPDIARELLSHDAPPLIAARMLDEGNLELLLQVMGGAPDIEYRPVQYERFEYQERMFWERMCDTKLNEKETLPTYPHRCRSVKVPLVYNSDQVVTAVFDVGQPKVFKLVAEDPW